MVLCGVTLYRTKKPHTLSSRLPWVFFNPAFMSNKPFDRVPQRRLAMKLNAHGIGGGVNRWITEWLLGRVQCVFTNGTSSGWSPVKSGVPRWSVFGSILFVPYINDT